MKQKYYNLLELFLIFIITLIFILVFHDLVDDEVWNYGFAYNVSTGLIPYRDFNMVTTPLYPMVDALFMKIFGQNIITHYIFCAIACTCIFSYIKKSNSKSYFLPYAILLLYAVPTYNIMCLLLLLIIINMEEKHSNDYLIGIILGLTFLTKQNTGIFLCIPTLFTKDIKKIVKRIVGFIIPNIIILMYLIYNNALYQFIDYCFLGIGEFAEKNILIRIPALVVLIISIIYLIYKYIKTKNIEYIYLLCFFGMSYPLIDTFHVIIPFIPTLTYGLSDIKLNKKIISIAFIIFTSTISIYNIYGYSSKGTYSFPNGTNTFKHRKIDDKSVKQINILSSYVKNNGKNTFSIDDSGYLIKLENNDQIGRYDYFLTGNVGKNGEEKLIKDFNNICQKENCTFILNDYAYNSNEYTQYNRKLHEYVVNNYKYSETIKEVGLQVYRNYEKKSDVSD